MGVCFSYILVVYQYENTQMNVHVYGLEQILRRRYDDITLTLT